MGIIKSNLPSDSQLWGRDIENRLAALETAVASNEVNNIARDQTMQASISNMSSLLADQAEMQTYSTNTITTSSYRWVNAINAGAVGSFETSDLTLDVSVKKPRNLIIGYSGIYNMNSVTSSLDDVRVRGTIFIYVNNSLKNTYNIEKRFVAPTGTNTFASTFGNNFVIPVEAGDYHVNVKFDYDILSIFSNTEFFITNDELSVQITNKVE